MESLPNTKGILWRYVKRITVCAFWPAIHFIFLYKYWKFIAFSTPHHPHLWVLYFIGGGRRSLYLYTTRAPGADTEGDSEFTDRSQPQQNRFFHCYMFPWLFPLSHSFCLQRSKEINKRNSFLHLKNIPRLARGQRLGLFHLRFCGKLLWSKINRKHVFKRRTMLSICICTLNSAKGFFFFLPLQFRVFFKGEYFCLHIGKACIPGADFPDVLLKKKGVNICSREPRQGAIPTRPPLQRKSKPLQSLPYNSFLTSDTVISLILSKRVRPSSQEPLWLWSQREHPPKIPSLCCSQCLWRRL